MESNSETLTTIYEKAIIGYKIYTYELWTKTKGRRKGR